jgi:NAD(P)-dependent dehydrogenase (short-subunit alcohol dehydrogenase family)
MTSNRTAIVTGAYGAIGKAIAEGIARTAGYRVVVLGRDKTLISQTAGQLIVSTGNTNIIGVAVDLGSKKEIMEFAQGWKGPLHVLVNNAATAPVKKTLTQDGIEMQWAVNVLGYYWMMKCLNHKMQGLTDARIINVASYWAGGLNMDDPEFKQRTFNNDDAYRQSKQADRMLSRFFAAELAASGITVNACHPGDVNSKLSNSLGFGGHESPAKGAATPLWLATSNEISGITGKYFEHKSEAYCGFSADQRLVQELSRLCGNY